MVEVLWLEFDGLLMKRETGNKRKMKSRFAQWLEACRAWTFFRQRGKSNRPMHPLNRKYHMRADVPITLMFLMLYTDFVRGSSTVRLYLFKCRISSRHIRSLSIRRVLPEIAPLISRIVHNLADTCDVDVLNNGSLAI